MAPRREVGAKILGNAPRGRNLLPEEQQQIIALRERGVPVKELMEEFSCSKSAIKYTTRTYTTTSAQDKPYTGRPRMLSRHQQKLVFRKVRAMLKVDYVELAKVAQVISLGGTPLKLPSKDTLYREIKRQGIGHY
jgi:transposase